MFMDLSNPKPSIYSALFVLAMVIITVPLAKVLANKFNIPGLTPLINAI